MKKAYLLSLAVLFLLTVADQGDCTSTTILKKYLESEQACVNLSQKAGNFIHEGKIPEAYDLLYSPDHYVRLDVPDRQRQLVVTNFKAMHDDLSEEFGRPIRDGFEYVGSMKTGDSIFTVYFLSKHDFMPFPWKMVFYKPEDEWKFMDVSTGPELFSEFIFFAKQVNLKGAN